MDLSESSPSRRVRRRRLFSFLTAAGVVTGYVGCGFPDHTFIDDDEFYGRAGSGNGGSSGSGFDAGPDSSVSTGGVTTGGAGGTGGGGGSGGGTGGVIGTGGALDAGGDAKVCPTGGCPLECGQLTDCNGECVSVQTDERHCGFCDTPCDPGESCTDGQCLGLCVTGDNCDGVCVDTDMDERYCGNCTTACGAGEYCAFGICATGCAVSEDLGSAVGRPVTSGTTAGATDAIAAPCQSNDSAEVAYRWTAPVDGTFTIDTLGSTLSDTILWVSDGNCGGPLLACSDDAFLRRSRVEVPLTEGQVIIIYVDAYGGATGNFQLNIELGVDGPCCAPQNTLGCAADSNVESCVCDIRSCCCGSGGGPLCEPKWNFVCTNIALTQCNACAVN